jgi:hypothetical protein
MTDEAEGPPISRRLRVDNIRDGASGEIAATEAEMAASARLLDLLGLERLIFAYRLRPGAAGCLRLTGSLKAAVTQSCVVSLDPVVASLDVPVEVEFWPPSLIEELEASIEEPGSTGRFDWPEPIIDGKIDLGPVIYETLATALDLYPKREGVSFDWSQDGMEAGGARQSGPFAALAKLKRG